MNENEYKKIIENIEKEKKYESKEGILYRKKKEKRLQVIRRWEMEGVLYMMHDHMLSAHFGIKATYKVTQINGNGYTKLYKGAVVTRKIIRITRHLQRADVI